jgi:hypothetical protein
MEGIKDSNFVNFANSIDAIHRKLATPKKRGVRDGNLGGEAELQANLKKDMVSIITSPLSQLGKLGPINGLSPAQVEALRVLYALVKVYKTRSASPDESLEAALEAAVRLLNPTFSPRINEEVAENQNGNGDSTTGTSSGQRKIDTIFIDNISRRAIYAGAQKHTISSATRDLL